VGNVSRTVLLFAIVACGLTVTGWAQTAGLGLRPMRLEIDARPGEEKTRSFTIESPPSNQAIAGRLILGLGDWSMSEDTRVNYHDPGTQSNSASEWLTFSPTGMTIISGQERLVRVTARVPDSARPGVYTSALFVQERPPTAIPKPGESRFYFRYRYVVTVYVIVAPVTPKGLVSNLRIVTDPNSTRIECELANVGTRHLRPNLSWVIRSKEKELLRIEDVEATVLLPSFKTRETLPLNQVLPPGEYEVEVQADFHDNGPIQSVSRVVVIGK
jgi:hypothetical protein